MQVPYLHHVAGRILSKVLPTDMNPSLQVRSQETEEFRDLPWATELRVGDKNSKCFWCHHWNSMPHSRPASPAPPLPPLLPPPLPLPLLLHFSCCPSLSVLWPLCGREGRQQGKTGISQTFPFDTFLNKSSKWGRYFFDSLWGGFPYLDCFNVGFVFQKQQHSFKSKMQFGEIFHLWQKQRMEYDRILKAKFNFCEPFYCERIHTGSWRYVCMTWCVTGTHLRLLEVNVPTSPT